MSSLKTYIAKTPENGSGQTWSTLIILDLFWSILVAVLKYERRPLTSMEMQTIETIQNYGLQNLFI